MVNGETVELEAVAGRVLAFDPGQIRSRNIGVVTELERVGAVLVAQVRHVAHLEIGLSTAEAACAVGAGNVEVRGTPRGSDVGVLGGHALTQVTDVGVQQQVRTEGIRTANAD